VVYKQEEIEMRKRYRRARKYVLLVILGFAMVSMFFSGYELFTIITGTPFGLNKSIDIKPSLLRFAISIIITIIISLLLGKNVKFQIKKALKQ